MAEDYGYDLFKTLALAGAGVILLYGINKFFQLRSSPIVIGNKSPEEATSVLTIDLPEFWIPYQPGDSKDSVALKYTPNIGVEGSNWLVHFNPISAVLGGINTTYTPDPIKIPITETLTIAQLATRFVPIVNATSNPIGWNVKFAPITILK